MASQITKLELTDISMFEHAVFSDLSISMLALADNGHGKDTTIDVFKALFKAHNPKLIRQGCSSGTINMEALVDDTVVSVKQRITPTGSKREVRCNGELMSDPEEFLKELVGSTVFDLSRFVNGSDAERLELYLGMFPISFTHEEINAAWGSPYAEEGQYELRQLEDFIAIAKKEQTQANAAKKNSEETFKNLSAKVPPDFVPSTDWDKEVSVFEKAVEEAKDAGRAAAQKIENDHRDRTNAISSDLNKKIAALNKQESEEIAQITARYRKLENEAREASDKKQEEQNIAKEKIVSEVIPPLREGLVAAQEALSSAKAKKMAADSLNALYQLKESARETNDSAVAAAAVAKDRVKDLTDLRKNKTEHVGVPGIRIENGIFYVVNDKGVEVEFGTQLNGAERWKAAFLMVGRIAKKKSLPLIVMGNAGDELNSENIDWFMELAEKHKIQVFMCKRAEGQPLTMVNYRQYKKEIAERKAA